MLIRRDGGVNFFALYFFTLYFFKICAKIKNDRLVGTGSKNLRF